MLGLLMLTGGIMHFTIPASNWRVPLIDALDQTGYMWTLVGVIIMVAGVALLLNRFVPLTLLVLAPITLNILLIHLANPQAGGIPIGIIVFATYLVTLWTYKNEYRVLLSSAKTLEP